MTESSQRLEIVAFCDYYRAPMVGGAERVALEIYPRLQATGAANTTVVTGIRARDHGNRGGHGEDSADRVAVVECRGVDLSSVLGAQLLFAPQILLTGWRTVRSRRPDVIHASSIHFLGSVAAAVIATLTRTPLVTTCHLADVGHLPRRTRWGAALYERTVGRFVLRRSRAVIAVSAAVRDHVLALGVDDSRLALIENGVDVERFSAPPRVAGDGPVRLAVVGRMIDNKGTLQTARALHLVPGDFAAEFVGGGPLEPELRRLATRDERMTVIGHRDDVENVLAAADVFIRYSTTEGRSLAVLEAMAAGCAVVVSDIAANVEIIHDDDTGVVVPLGDEVALAAAVEVLLADADRRARLGSAAQAAVASLDWNDVATRTHKVLSSAADE